MRANFPALNQALDAALGESDDSQRPARFQAVNAAFNKLLPWGPMWVATRYGVASTAVKGFVWTPAPSGGGYVASAQGWSL
jgi:peptide/nickel transport system substrate-binding protein